MKAALLCTTALMLCGSVAAQQTSTQAIDRLLTLRGVNAGVQDALQGWPQVMQQFPGMTALRLNANPGKDSSVDINTVVTNYTGAGVTVEIEDHSGNPDNVLWYRQMAGMFKGNPLVLLEMPNEPSANNVVSDQVGLIKAIRAAGFTNPIGVQPVGGFDFSNVGAVVAQTGATGLFVTPHIYYGGTDPNGAVDWVNSAIAQANAIGMPVVIDEFGNALDGVTQDPQGDAVMLAVLAANEGTNGGTVRAGAIFWAMDNGNHPDGADSAFLTPDGSQLTSTGSQVIQPWLSQPGKPKQVISAVQAQRLADLSQQTDAVQQQIGGLQQAVAAMPASSGQCGTGTFRIAKGRIIGPDGNAIRGAAQITAGSASNMTASPISTVACQPNVTQPAAFVTPPSTAPVPSLPATVASEQPPSAVTPAPTVPVDVSAELKNDQVLLQQAQSEIAAVVAQIAALQQQQSSSLPEPVTDTSPAPLSVETMSVQASAPIITDMAPTGASDSGGGGDAGGDAE
jgi:cellulase (glycosyl hydrolase family 5)